MAPLSYEALAAAQNSDDKLGTLLTANNSLRLEKQPIPGRTVFTYYDTSIGKSRPYSPAPLRLQVLQSIHDLLHPGRKETAKLVARLIVWPSIKKNCRTIAGACQACQHSKVSHHTVTPLGDFTPPPACFLHFYIGLVRPLPMSARYTYCQTAVDHFTRWPEAIPIPDITPKPGAKGLLTCWISHFGCFQTISIDHWRQFETTLSLPGQTMRNCTFLNNRTTSCIQWTSATLPPPEERVVQLQDCPPPQDHHRVSSPLRNSQFLDMQAAVTQAPLHDVLSGPRVKGSQPIACKESLWRATQLAHPEPTAQLAVVTDASTTAMGAILQQRIYKAWQPLAFFSGKLNPTQQKYSAYDREFLAAYETVKYFRHMLEARHFIIFTDHKPITYAFQQKRDKWQPPGFYCSVYDRHATHNRTAQDNIVADTLSRRIRHCATIAGRTGHSTNSADGLRALLTVNNALWLEKQPIPGTTVSI
jgi:hypothetical protein